MRLHLIKSLKPIDILICLLILYNFSQITLRVANGFIEYDEGYNLTVSVNFKNNLRYESFDSMFDPNITTGPTVLLLSSLFVEKQYPLLARIPILIISLIFISYVCIKILSTKKEILTFLIIINFVPYFFFLSSHVLGEITALLLLIISFVYIVNKKFIIGGIYLGLCLLTKNVFLITLIPILYFELFHNNSKFFAKVINILKIGGGVLAPLVIWEFYKFAVLEFNILRYIQLQKELLSVLKIQSRMGINLLELKLDTIEIAFDNSPFLILLLLFISNIYVLFSKEKFDHIKLIAIFCLIYILYYLFLGPTNFYRHFFPGLVLWVIVIGRFIRVFMKNFTYKKKFIVLLCLCIYMLITYSYRTEPGEELDRRKKNKELLLISDEENWPYLFRSEKLISQYRIANFINNNTPHDAIISGTNWWNAPEISFLLQKKIHRYSTVDKYYLIRNFYGLWLDPSSYYQADLHGNTLLYKDYLYELYRIDLTSE